MTDDERHDPGVVRLHPLSTWATGSGVVAQRKSPGSPLATRFETRPGVAAPQQ
jgi:hypothetical protein